MAEQPLSNLDFFSHRVDNLRSRVSVLFQQLREPTSEKNYVESSFLDLVTALEELQVADEELHQQMEELEIITDQASTERRRYEEFFEYAPEAYLITSPSGSIQEANPAACALLQKKVRALVGKPLVVWIPEVSRSLFRSKINELIQTKEALAFQAPVQFQQQAGNRLFSFKLFPVMAAGQKVRAIRWQIHDVTNEAQAQSELKAQRALKQALFDGAITGIALFNPQGFILESNPALQRLLKYSGEALRALSFADLFHLADLETVSLKFRQVAEGQADRFQIEARMQPKDEAARWVRLSVSAYPGETALERLIFGMVSDIDEQKQAQIKLSETHEKYLESLRSERRSLAHHLNRSAMEDISLAAQRLESLEQALETDPNASLPFAAAEVAQACAALEQTLSDLSVTVEALNSPAWQPFDLKNALALFLEQTAWENPGVSCDAVIEGDLRRLGEDTCLELFGIFRGAVQDRLRHTRPDQIHVQVRALSDKVEIEIQDNGKDSDHLAQLSDLIAGGRLLLASAMERAEAIHGSLSIETTSLGSGAVVHVVAPLKD